MFSRKDLLELLEKAKGFPQDPIAKQVVRATVKVLSSKGLEKEIEMMALEVLINDLIK